MSIDVMNPEQNGTEPVSAWFSAVRPLLAALGWRGDERHLSEVLPKNAENMGMNAFRDTMAYLGFASVIRHGNPRKLDARWLPAFWIDAEDRPHALLSLADRIIAPDNAHLRLILFSAVGTVLTADPNSTLVKTLRRFHPLLRYIFLMSLAIGAIAMGPTFFNMAIYDHVIASASSGELAMLLVGITLCLCVEIGLRHIRAERLAYFGARIDHFVSCSVFERLLFLPPVFTERASVSAQLARLRDFAAVREFFTGPLSALFFEMPLVLVYLIAMACIGHWLAFVPVTLVFSYAFLLWSTDGTVKECSRASARASSARHEFLLETISHLHAIRLSGMEETWQQRWRQISSAASIASFRTGYIAQLVEVFSYILMTLGAVATLGFGVVMVINQDLSAGALIASVMLLWRIVSPLQLACASTTRIQQLAASARQVQKLLSMPVEHDPYLPPAAPPRNGGHLSFHRVTMRYAQDMEPAVLGVSFEARPGQVIAIRGGNGSGKSTLLKLAMGLYQPQGGSVRIGGVDIRQLDPPALRHAITYVPQKVDLFPGTVRDNLLLSSPTIDDKGCREALQAACALEEIMRLPEGLDTVIVGEGAQNISFLLKQRLNLARAYLRPAPLMLFDEASYSLGKDNDDSFARMISSLRGRCTVILATHREDHMLLADTLISLSGGELTHMGPPDQVLAVLRAKRHA